LWKGIQCGKTSWGKENQEILEKRPGHFEMRSIVFSESVWIWIALIPSLAVCGED
jgi:hypothetical protein